MSQGCSGVEAGLGSLSRELHGGLSGVARGSCSCDDPRLFGSCSGELLGSCSKGLLGSCARFAQELLGSLSEGVARGLSQSFSGIAQEMIQRCAGVGPGFLES